MESEAGRVTLGTPLASIRVADFTRVLAGPLATMTLADLGADVIKVERPGSGDETRSWGPPWSAHGSTYFECVNRTKRSIALNLRDPVDRATALRIAQDADVVIENFAPGTMERLGLGYDAVSTGNPGVVYCSISGFGSAAPDGLLGYDFVVQAVGGLMSITGDPDGVPTKVGVALVDVLTGKDAVIGILAALEGRRRTGRGDRIEVSLLSSLLAGLVNQVQAALETGRPGQRLANRHPSIAPYETLRCSDGVVAVACGNDAQFARLTGVLGLPELATDPRFAGNADRVGHRDTLAELLEQRLRTGSAAAWVERLTRAKVPAGRVNTIPEALAFAQQVGLDPVVDVGPGHTRQVRPPIRWTAYSTRPPTPPPALGADTGAVFGLTKEML
ncbi:formyl-CoA transferase [Kribbella aluminosa]|uniref:Formyl-CoA transferase n=1 Tax=Kribbella aluminosa TaxID=416017 RepID=A0ABS4UK17_9ACTN|nr:CoA transferase [Kribbella aluminosa]MBP2351998.1 formyl-CoA transferase [Kribbella aluminosa]